jgi:hypothetical protein
VYPRFRQVASAAGQIRISRDVAVQAENTVSEISVLSDAAGVIGEVLTLALVSSTAESEMRVRVVDSRPHFTDGVLRHRVRLQIMPPDSTPG